MRIAIGMPIVDSVPGEAFISHIMSIMATRRSEEGGVNEVVMLCPFNMLPHDRARSDIVKTALRADCDLIFFIDDDMLLPWDAFPKMLTAMKKEQAAVVSGHYYRRGYPYTCVWSKAGPSGAPELLQVHTLEDKLFEIDCSGLGCALVDLRWLSKNVPPPMFTMFNTDGTAQQVTDDVSFFEKVRSAGGKVIGHGGIRCGHLGERLPITDQNADALRKAMMEVLNTVQT